MINRPVQLPQGPPELITEIYFTPRELEFISLRYGKALSCEKIAEEMNITHRTIKNYGQIIHLKLGIAAGPDCGFITAIKEMGILLRHGFLKLEDIL